MKTSEIVAATVSLSKVPASQAKFTVPLLLVDHADVPIDKRYLITTRSAYTTDLTASTEQLAWATEMWSQNYNPSQLYVGRRIATATASYLVLNDTTTVASVYAALTNTGQFAITEVGESAVQINPDFTGDTSMSDVAASITAAFAAAAGITAAYTCTVESNSYGRLIMTSDNTGASAALFSIAAPVAGTDLTGALYLGTGFQVAGNDVETFSAAASAVFALDDTPFIVNSVGGVLADRVTLSTGMNALNKICLIDEYDTDAKDSSSTTDVSYQLGPNGLSHQKTWGCYTEHATVNGKSATQYPTAAICGEVFPRREATTSLALTPYSGLSESGLGADDTTTIPLTATERSALEAKNCDYLVNPAGSVHAVKGLAYGGNEIRIMVGKMFLEAKISEDIYAYMIANDVVTFSDADIQAIKSIVAYWIAELVDRKVLDGSTVVWNFPAAADFTATQKATHTMTLSNVVSVDAQSAVNDITITLSFTV